MFTKISIEGVADIFLVKVTSAFWPIASQFQRVNYRRAKKSPVRLCQGLQPWFNFSAVGKIVLLAFCTYLKWACPAIASNCITTKSMAKPALYSIGP
jgi:hypothetical protein